MIDDRVWSTLGAFRTLSNAASNAEIDAARM
jgi:hypothetical protein